MKTTKVKELTIEEQIAEVRREAERKVKELQKELPWEKRFSLAFNQYSKNKSRIISQCINGAKPNDFEFEDTANSYLKDSDFKLTYESATFDNDLYNKTDLNTDYDLSEYPVYAVYAVKDLKNELKGYIQLNCLYSSYNGNEYNSWHFVKAQEITCKIYTMYVPSKP